VGEVRGVGAERAATLVDGDHDLRAIAQGRRHATDAAEQLEDRNWPVGSSPTALPTH
jgi:hypothetical protein